jgi:hypothetical protein
MAQAKVKIASICSDRVKYMLMNAVEVASKGAVIPRLYAKSRSRLFAAMHCIHSSAEKSNVKPKHLYVIPYSRYYTLRQMMYDEGGELETDEDDEEIKSTFKAMMSKHHSSKQALENEFFSVIKGLKNPTVFRQYVELDEKILRGQLNEDEMFNFIEATAETDIFIVKKLSSDVGLFMTKKEKVLKFLEQYRFVNGWITAGGVAVLTWRFYIFILT